MDQPVVEVAAEATVLVCEDGEGRVTVDVKVPNADGVTLTGAVDALHDLVIEIDRALSRLDPRFRRQSQHQAHPGSVSATEPGGA